MSSIMDVGQSLGPMVTGVLIASFSYRTAFSVVGLGMMAVSLIYGFMMPRSGQQPAAN